MNSADDTVVPGVPCLVALVGGNFRPPTITKTATAECLAKNSKASLDLILFYFIVDHY